MQFTKKLLVWVSISFVVVFFLLVGAWGYASTILTEEFIVHQLESLFNARFGLKSYSVGILSGGNLDIEDVAIAKRDRYANQATPLQKRPPISSEALAIQKISLDLDLFALVGKKFRLDGFIIEKPEIRLVVNIDGSNNLSPLFAPPAIVAGKPNPQLNELKSKPKKEAPSTAPKQKKSEPFQAQSVPLAASLGEIGIKNGNISVALQNTGDSLRIEKLNFLITDIEFDPQDLQNKNSADVQFRMDLKLFTKTKKETGHFILHSGGRVVPFNRETGRIDPKIVYALAVKKNSYLSGFTVLEKLSGHLDTLKKANISLDKLREKAVLTNDVHTKVNYSRGVVSILKNTEFITQHFNLIIDKGTKFFLQNAAHVMDGEIAASKSISREALQGVDTILQKNLKMNANEVVETRNSFLQTVLRNEQFYLPFHSEGLLSNPRVKLKAKLPSISELAKNLGSRFLKKEQKKLEGKVKKEFEKQKEKAKSQAKESVKEEGKKLLKNLF